MSDELIDMHNRITTEELERLVRHQLKQISDHPEQSKMLPPLMIWGAPGIGKSSIIRNIAKELGIGFIDVRLAQREPVGTGDTLHLRKIAPHFLVQINKADNAGVGVPGQHRCHEGELLNVAFNRIGVGKKNRVIPPADAVRADNLG